MERLTIKELAPYLPYELKVKDEEYNEIFEVCSYNPNTDEWLVYDNIDGSVVEYSLDILKPILRPLSQLTKEIEHNGEKFVPMVELEKIRKDIEIYRPLNLHYPLEINIQTEDYSQEIDLHDGYLIMQKLLEWHFDVFGLREKNLALPIDGKEVKS